MVNNNKLLRSKYRHTRLVFTPLRVSCTLECATPLAPCTQTFNSFTGEYEPDRTVSPTVIRVNVNVVDKDGVFGDGNANARLSLDHLNWYVNGTPIADVENNQGQKIFVLGTNYSILTTANENRGALVLNRNVSTDESFELHFEGQFEDWRTGTIVKVKNSTPLVLTTSEKGDDEISISVDSAEIVYCPLKDRLLLFDYLTGQGITPDFTQNSCYDGQQYDRTVNILLTQGKNNISSVPTGMAIGLFIPNSNSQHIVGDDDIPEFVSLSSSQLRFDLRMVETGNYELALYQINPFKKVASCDIKILRKMPSVDDAFPNFGTDIVPGQQRYFNDGSLIVDGSLIPYPELYYHLEWFTQAVKKTMTNGVATFAPDTAVARQIGERMECDVNDIGIGVTKNDNYFETFFDVYERGKFEVLTDENGNELTDENDNELIAD